MDLIRKCSFCDGLGTTGPVDDLQPCSRCNGAKTEAFGSLDLSDLQNQIQSVSDMCQKTLEIDEKILEIVEKIKV